LWRVKNGAIVGSTDRKTIQQNWFLSSERTFSDFILRAKFKLQHGNSGIQFRNQLQPDFVVEGYQAEMGEPKYRHVALYYQGRERILSETDPAELGKHWNEGGWNEYEITCNGPRIKRVLNAETFDGRTSGFLVK